MLEVGYCLIDIVIVYENESGVGEVICELGILREDIFIIIKVWNDD